MLKLFLIKIYLRYFVLILIALEFLFVGMDFISSYTKLPDSANLKTLYILFMSGAGLKITLPIALTFATITTVIELVKKNELVAMYSIGINKKNIFRPILYTVLSITLFYISLFFTSFAYNEDNAVAIKKDRYFFSATDPMFLKYDQSYVYIKNLYPLENFANGVKIFSFDDEGLLNKIISSENAYFEGDSWRLVNTEVISKPNVTGLQKDGVTKEYYDFIITLDGFKPSIMDKVYEGKSSLSIIDGILAISLLAKQGINNEKIRGILYSIIFTPLFIYIFIVAIFTSLPVSSRFFNLAFYTSISIFLSLCGWGFIFAITQLAISGSIYPELAIPAPFFLLLFVGMYIVKKRY